MATTSRQSRATSATYGQPGSPSGSWARRVPNPLDVLEPALKRRDEAELVFVADNIALVAFDIIEWPVAVLTLAAHVMARSRFKALQGVAELLEEAGQPRSSGTR